jgi:uncharacterized protein YndB with AHSA1/START domain
MVVTTSSDREILETRVFEAPRQLVFEAWTDPKHVPLRILYPSKEARDAALQTGMKDGMSQSFDRLAEHAGAML